MRDKISDGRAAAWIAAWQVLESAGKYRQEFAKEEGVTRDTPLPPAYHAAVAEADVLARLATADTIVGVSVGGVLQQRAERETEHERTVLDDIMGRKKQPTEGGSEE